jgi:hypothetical protein
MPTYKKQLKTRSQLRALPLLKINNVEPFLGLFIKG